VPSTKLLLVTSEQLEVQEAIEHVEKRLQNAARSTPGTLAWLTDAGTEEQVGVNPNHVMTLRPGDE
jgi:hypothetical protein